MQKKKDEIYLYDQKEKEKKLEQTKIINQERILSIKKNKINDKCITIEYLNKIEKKKLENNKDNKNKI